MTEKLPAFLARQVLEASKLRLAQVQSQAREARLVFLGPPLEILERVFEQLTSVTHPGQEHLALPVLLQVPKSMLKAGNPAVGMPGWCDHAHLLTVRDTASAPSFVALVPPDQHMDLSVATTVDMFGVGPKASSGMASFDEWWADPFVQQVVGAAIASLGQLPDTERARRLIEAAAREADEVGASAGGARAGAWRVISRVFDSRWEGTDAAPGVRLAAACGMPPTVGGDVRPELQTKALGCIADALEDGFKTGIDRAVSNATDDETRDALEAFRSFIQDACDIPTAFERAPSAYYSSSTGLGLAPPPSWWSWLTAERWIELLEDSRPGIAGVTIEVGNTLSPIAIGGVHVVLEDVDLRVSQAEPPETPHPVVLERRVGSGTRGRTAWDLTLGAAPVTGTFDVPPHKAPVRFIVVDGDEPVASAKVISMATWDAGIHVQSRTARKLTPARRRPTPASSTKPAIECTLVLDGPGRHLVDIFLSPGVVITEVATLHGQDDESGLAERSDLEIRKVTEGHFSVEVDASGDSDLDLIVLRGGTPGTRPETCRAHLGVAEVRATGCASEFERLVLENRGAKRASVQVDRVARSSILEAWMLDGSVVSQSWIPTVLGEDYSSAWAQPSWASGHGPLVSSKRFISDPRPAREDLVAPPAFVDARARIAARIRGDENTGLTAEARLGEWYHSDATFRQAVDRYLDSYVEWWVAEPDIACWVDVVAVASTGRAGTETLSPRLDAIILSPLHPVRLAWQCAAQEALSRAIEGGMPCPAAALLDPDVVPDILRLSIRGPDGPEHQTFVAVECSSDYWGVMWSADQLEDVGMRSRRAPFGPELGLSVGGLARGFSPSQISKALNDVSDLLAAKPVLSISLSSSGAGLDSCNEGIAEWSRRRFGEPEDDDDRHAIHLGPRLLDVHDSRPPEARPDEPSLSNLVEDTSGAVRWFLENRKTSAVDLAVVTQLEAADAMLTSSQERSAMSPGGLLRHRIRRQLPQEGQAYLVESRQCRPAEPSGVELLDKLGTAISRIENAGPERQCFRFAPDVLAIKRALDDERADYVAVSSTAVDPGCFVGDWLKGAYLWDYSLPSYSQRSGDTSGNYLISSIKEVDREALANVISKLPGASRLEDHQADALLHEIARRGIPTVREISGDDSRAAGALGMFVAARVLQDTFRVDGGPGGLLPVTSDRAGARMVTIVVPVDPFKAHLDELARAVKAEKAGPWRRPDLLVATFHVDSPHPAVRLVPLEVKLRSGQPLSKDESIAALAQAKALSSTLQSIASKGESSHLWRLALGHLLLSMTSFGIRIYGQNRFLSPDGGREWSRLHESLAAAILGGTADVQVDDRGRLIVIDSSPASGPVDRDGDGFAETIVLSLQDAARVMVGDPIPLYQGMREQLGGWDVEPGEGPSPATDRGSSQSRDQAPVTNGSPAAGEGRDSSAIVAGTPDVPPGGGAAPAVATIRLAGDGTEPHGDQAEPAGSSGIVLRLGKAAGTFESRDLSLNISDTRLNQLNIGVVGDLGTGKTQLLKSLISQITTAAERNRGVKPRFLIFDYKKDYSSPDFVQAVGAKVVKPYRMPLNIFDTTGMVESLVPWLDRFKFFADVLDKIFGGIGPVQRDKLKQAVKRAYESAELLGRMPTLYDVHAEYRAILGTKSDAPLAIIDDLVDSEVFVPSPPTGASFAGFFDGVVVVSLAAMGQDDRSKNMVVALMLNMFYEHVLNLPKRPFVGTDPQLRVIDSYLLVDEADNIMQYEFDVLRKLLLQGREFGVGVVLASQYLRHFKVNATDYRDPLLTWFIHKVPNVTASELAGLGLTADLGELAERVKGLPNHHCLFKSFGGQSQIMRGLPFYELVAGADGATRT